MSTPVDQAKTYVREGQPLLAIELLESWLRVHREDASAWSALSAARYELDNYPAALDAAEQAVELRPQSARNWCNLGMLLRKLGRLDEAERAQHRALCADSTYDRARTELRKIHDVRTDHPGSAARPSEPSDDQLINPVERAKRFVREDQPLIAAELLQPWLEANPGDAEAWAAMSAARYELDNYRAALEAAERVIQLRPASARNWCNLGMILRKIGRLYEAEKALYRALSLDSSYRRARTELRKIHDLRVGERDSEDHLRLQ